MELLYHSLSWCKWIDHLNDSHHTSIFMWKNVAMKDEFSKEIREWDTNHRFTTSWNHYRILQAMCIIWLTIYQHNLKVIDMNLKCMIFGIEIFKRPLLYIS